MTFEDLQQLFYKGELDQVIELGEAHIERNPDDIDSLLLLATAYHDKVYYDGHEAVFTAIASQVIPCLRRALEVDPNHQQALYEILDYPLGNQFNLLQVGSVKQHITAANRAEFLAYADRLIADIERTIYGYDFKVKLYESLEDYEALVETVDSAITYCKQEYAGNRELMDRNVSVFWMKKVYVLDHTKMVSSEELMAVLEAGLDRFVCSTEYNMTDMAEMAYEAKDIDLALQILLKLIKGDNTNFVTQDKLATWYKRFDALIKAGYDNANVFYYQLIIARNYYELIGLEEEDYYQLATEVMEAQPRDFAGYHFAGTYLYEAGRFEEAVPLLEEAMRLGAGSTTWRRMVIASYKTHTTLAVDVPSFGDWPRELYNEAIELDDFATALANTAHSNALRKLSLALYQQTYDAFEAYFEAGKYTSDYYGDLHNRAMNCNNLAIVHAHFENYAEAAAIAAEGLRYSEFEELHHTLIDALRKGKDYEGTQVALNAYFANYTAEQISFYKHAQHLATQIEVDYALGAGEDLLENAQETLFMLYDHQLDNPDISDYDFRDYEAAKNVVEGVLYQMMEEELVEQRIAFFEAIAQRYPQEAHPHYVLMQFYNEVDSYAEVAMHGEAYLDVKKAFLMDSFDRAKTNYLIMKSKLFGGDYAAATNLFEKEDKSIREALDTGSYVAWLRYGIRTYGKLKAKDKVLALCEQYDAIYEAEGWGYDKEMEEVYLVKALSQYEAGDLKEAHATLDYILSFSDHADLADSYKANWKKLGLFARLGF